MIKPAIEQPKDGHITIVMILVALALAGLLLIAVSLLIPVTGQNEYYHDLTKELGIVLLSVFTVSLLYEVMLAKKHSAEFLKMLRQEVEQGEGNAAACANLGIEAIFPRRDEYELKYPIAAYFDQLGTSSTLRIIARTLFLMMNKTQKMRRALEQGATLEFCIFDPWAVTAEIARSPDIEASDLETVVSIFRKQIAEWAITAKPPGTVILRTHRYAMLDSCLMLTSPERRFCVWDLSFGRDLTSKRVLMVDAGKPLGRDLTERYDFIWNNSIVLFEYHAGEIIANKLKQVVPATVT